jgi:hypothetical protein
VRFNSFGRRLRSTQSTPNASTLRAEGVYRVKVTYGSFSVQISKDELQTLAALIALLFGLTAK